MELKIKNLTLVCEAKDEYFDCRLLKGNEILTKMTLDEFGGTIYLSPNGEVAVDIAKFKLRSLGKPFDVNFEWE